MKNKTKIMLLVPMLHQGGFERICALTAKLLKDTYEVYVVIFTKKDQFYDVDGVNLIDLDLGALDGKIQKAVQICRRIRAVKKLKKELGIEITYSFGTSANLVNVLSKAQDVTWAGIRGYSSLTENMRLIGRKADRVISCTSVMEKDIKKIVRLNSSATLYNPCNLEEIDRLSQMEVSDEIQAFLAKPGKVIVSMGREDDLKGFWHLIKSFSLVQKKIPDTKLMIIGDGTYTEYKKLAEELGVHHVMFTGVQKNPFAILRQTDVYALTSITEGFPNALIEAMAVGLPCVSVNCKTGPAEILCDNFEKYEDQTRNYKGDYGILTAAFQGSKDLDASHIMAEEENFANELCKLLADDTLRAEYADKAKKRAQKFGMEAYVAEMERLIREDV